ncbi:outer surface lipoprotein OspB (plasmid) [Borreliella sinica]|uniref:outer surface lipoprotein OspB n=1 Tax=Borreliella sinica TaxID=87162 RepID=UPI002A23F77E|nr:outer surface lipoprotein OspB [Borreliella sinica]WPM06376.1 outer surface lipoprotein OspB [Borreliella sinica]
MRQYLLGFTLALALIACSQKGAEQKNSQDHNDQEIIDSKKLEKRDKNLPLDTERSVLLFNGNNIFISKEKNKAGKYDIRAIVDQIEFKGTSDKNNGSGNLEGAKADKSRVTILISDDLNTITVETYDVSDKKVSSKVVKKQGLITEENFKASKLDSKKITRSNETTIEYSQMTTAQDATHAVEMLKNGIKFEGNLVGGKTTLKVTEGNVTLTREIENEKIKVFLNDTTTGSNKKTATWQENSNTLTITADIKKTKDLVFLSDGTITLQNYDSNGANLEGKATEIKSLAELKGALK